MKKYLPEKIWYVQYENIPRISSQVDQVNISYLEHEMHTYYTTSGSAKTYL